MSASTATPKGQRRRDALIEAAADLLLGGGYDAVRHRSVAAKARLPLASTTYYFDSLDDLVARADELNTEREMTAVRSRLASVAHRSRSAPATAELLAELFVGPVDDSDSRELLLARYERFVASARQPHVREVLVRHRVEMEDVVTEALVRSGRVVDAERIHRLVSMIDGVVLDALGETDLSPRDKVRDLLLDLVDREAPMVEQFSTTAGAETGGT